MNSPVHQRRAPANRAFHGLSGSPLAQIIPFPEPQQQPQPSMTPKRGRPRKHKDNAAKQKTHRERKIVANALNDVLREHSETRGQFVSGAPHGQGQLVTGGYGSEKIHRVIAAQNRARKGGRTSRKGHGPYADESVDLNADQKNKGERIETDYTFARKIRFPKNWGLDEYEKSRILDQLVQENTEGEEEASDGWDEDSLVLMKASTLHCLLCNENIRVRADAQPHFLRAHLRFVQKTWKASAPKQTPKPCPGNHVVASKRLRDGNARGHFHCSKCRKLIYDSNDACFRNPLSDRPIPFEIIQLMPKIEPCPIGGEGVSACFRV